MNSILAAMLAAATYITPTPHADVQAFLRFMWANERCPAFAINFEKTLDQVRDLAQDLGWSNDQRQQAILAGTRAAKFDFERDSEGFCAAVQEELTSYDPAHLKKVGVID
ncbi:hypothetical protein [Shinella sp. JR1-6]|uniref:hypothetical protein n=1 Tax=Shinella sp. JR1-6 TaxID=2527671 RepID=UPI00102D40EC|nr:hypothetical protein [Shinella sp. JR1-6]TAA54602.1 hypothetical protein EXZ48_26620 [Shinella sp. JR1-6]